MNKTRILTVVVVVGLVVAWLLSGVLTDSPSEAVVSLAEAKEIRDTEASVGQGVLVRAKRSTAVLQDDTIVLRGRIVDRNQSTVPARTRGQVIARHVEIGDSVEEGDVLCELNPEDRQAQVDVAKDALDLAEKEFKSVTTLTERGFEQELDTARKKAQLSASKQKLLAAEIELENTKISAPIDGIVDMVHANVGDYVNLGSPCATLLVLDPVYAQGFVTEEYISELSLGSSATVTLPNGETREGELSFISKKAEENSRTFRVEIEMSNEDLSISSGMSATIEIVIASTLAHQVPTSVAMLDQEGSLGVKVVATNDLVEFRKVDIVREDSHGIWVSGLPERATIITVGQGLVVEGERVTVDFE